MEDGRLPRRLAAGRARRPCLGVCLLLQRKSLSLSLSVSLSLSLSPSLSVSLSLSSLSRFHLGSIFCSLRGLGLASSRPFGLSVSVQARGAIRGSSPEAQRISEVLLHSEAAKSGVFFSTFYKRPWTSFSCACTRGVLFVLSRPRSGCQGRVKDSGIQETSRAGHGEIPLLSLVCPKSASQILGLLVSSRDFVLNTMLLVSNALRLSTWRLYSMS